MIIKNYLKAKAYRYGIILLLFAVVSGGMNSCKEKRREEPVIQPKEEPVEYPVEAIPDFITTNISDDHKLYPLREEFLDNFIQKALEYQGEQVRIKIPFPVEWGVVSIERFPEGRELWLLQSLDREWKYVVITSGMGTQRILDLIPVALNLALQDQDLLETEIWTTHRGSDGSFIVEKNYEWIKSIENIEKEIMERDPGAYQRVFRTTDKYIVNDMNRFDYVPRQDEADYNAIVFYYNRESKPEEWDEYVPILQSYCEEKNIFFEEVYAQYDEVRIRDFKMNEVAEVDISPLMEMNEAGMIMLKAGEEPKNVHFGSYERMKIEIKRYFKLLNQ